MIPLTSQVLVGTRRGTLTGRAYVNGRDLYDITFDDGHVRRGLRATAFEVVGPPRADLIKIEDVLAADRAALKEKLAA